MAGMAEALPSLHMKVDVVPARGGFGNRVEYLPNFVAARMAEKLGGEYHIIHIPDGLSPELFLRVKKELPQFREIDRLLSRTDILVTGVDEPEDQSKWLEIPEDVRRRLIKEKQWAKLLVSMRIFTGRFSIGSTMPGFPGKIFPLFPMS